MSRLRQHALPGYGQRARPTSVVKLVCAGVGLALLLAACLWGLGMRWGYTNGYQAGLRAGYGQAQREAQERHKPAVRKMVREVLQKHCKGWFAINRMPATERSVMACLDLPQWATIGHPKTDPTAKPK